MDGAVVIDSCVFIDYFRAKDKDNSLLMKLVRQSQTIYVSAVAKYEVLAGAKDRDMEEWRLIFEDFLVLPFDDATISTARLIFRQLKRENKMVSLGDILIAATAIADGLPLATLNRKHFERIQGLRLV